MDITAIAIIAIIFGSIVTIVKTVFNHVGNKNKFRQLDNSSSKEIEQLKERVATLEKIVTDEKYDLKREFERL